MKQCILGISSFGHDTSACLVDVSNTKIIFASAQERYSNIKYDDTVPFFTINECIRIANDFNYKIIKATISCDYQLFLGDYLYKRILRITENKDITDKYLLLLKKNLNNSDYYSKFSIKKNQGLRHGFHPTSSIILNVIPVSANPLSTDTFLQVLVQLYLRLSTSTTTVGAISKYSRSIYLQAQL